MPEGVITAGLKKAIEDEDGPMLAYELDLMAKLYGRDDGFDGAAYEQIHTLCCELMKNIQGWDEGLIVIATGYIPWPGSTDNQVKLIISNKKATTGLKGLAVSMAAMGSQEFVAKWEALFGKGWVLVSTPRLVILETVWKVLKTALAGAILVPVLSLVVRLLVSTVPWSAAIPISLVLTLTVVLPWWYGRISLPKALLFLSIGMIAAKVGLLLFS